MITWCTYKLLYFGVGNCFRYFVVKGENKDEFWLDVISARLRIDIYLIQAITWPVTSAFTQLDYRMIFHSHSVYINIVVTS